MFGDNSPTGSGTDLVTYGAYGVTLLSSSQYSSSLTAGANVKLTSSPGAMSTSTTCQALVLSNSGTAAQLAISSGKTLTLSGAALLSAGSAANAITGGTLTFGANSATTYEGIVYTASNLTIGAAVTNNGGNAVSLTKSGPAVLSISGADTYSGGTTVGGGTMAVIAGGSLIRSGSVTVGAGGYGATFNVSGGTVSSSAGGNAFYLGSISGQTGIVNVSAGSVATTSGGETVMLGDAGAGIWNQSGGTTTVANQIFAANQFGSAGQLNVSGGYLSAGNGILVSVGGSGTLNLSGGEITTPCLALAGTNGQAVGTVNLNGGTLAVGSVQENYTGLASAGQAIFKFNGGLLRATGAECGLPARTRLRLRAGRRGDH